MKTLIKINDLTKIYDKRNTGGISNLTFEIKEGEILSILGPSGSGKTTLLNCLNQKITNYLGNIEALSELEISTVEQDESLDENLNVFDNIAKPILNKVPDEEKRINQVRTTLSQLDITNEMEKFPNELSSGQKQRVIIARALVSNPNLLLFDEAFGHLDEKLRRDLLEELLSLLKEKEITLVSITHHNEEALSYSDRIMILNFGKIQHIGTTDEVYHRPKNLFAAQFFSNSNALVTTFAQENGLLTFNLFNKEVKIPFPQSLEIIAGKEGLVIVSQEGILISQDGNYKGKIIEKHFKGHNSLYLIQSYERLLYCLAPSSIGKLNESVRFSIDFNSLRFLSEV